MKIRILLVAALCAVTLPAYAGLCTLFSLNQSCSFATDTSGGTATFTNPDVAPNVGSGVISPFLTQQAGGNGGVEFGVTTDIPNVNLLPLDDKRNNATTFTQTFLLSDLLAVNGFYIFELDANEPDNNPAKFLSLDTLRIWGRSGSTVSDPFLATNLNILNGGILDTLNTVFPDLQLIYALGPGNTLGMDATLFPGSGIGFDMLFSIPVSEFAGIDPNSRIVFTSGFGGADSIVPGALAQDGFEEWKAVTGQALPPPPGVPEPATVTLMGLALAGLGLFRRGRAVR